MTIAPKKILLIHNNSNERGKLAIMLSRFGHEVRFSSGKGFTDQMLMSNNLVILMISWIKNLDWILSIKFQGNFVKK